MLPLPDTIPLPGVTMTMTTAPSSETDNIAVLPTTTTTSPTAAPPMRKYQVPSRMVLYHSELLDANSEKVWMDATEETVHNEAVAKIGMPPELVRVKVELGNQNALEPLRMLKRNHDDDVLVAPPGSMRNLQQLSQTPLQIQFNVTIQFASVDEDWDAAQIVASGFQSPAQQKNYIKSLQEGEDSSTFDSLERMSMEVGEYFDSEKETPSQIDGTLNGAEGSDHAMAGYEKEAGNTTTAGGNENRMYFIIATVVGSVCILLFAVAIVIYIATRNKGTERNEKAQYFPTTAATSQDHHLPLDEIRMEVETKCETLYHQQTPTSYIGTIESKEDADDVSTLGDPYMGDAVNAVMDADHTVGESMVSTQQELYVYGVGRPTGMDATIGSTINSGSIRNMIFGDDTTLENLYRSPQCTSSTMMGDDQSNQFQCVTVVAPSGKLGIVLDNPHADLPIVWAIKETSSLHGRVHVGDLLMSVDGVDCRGMSTHRVSTFLSSRSQNAARTLVLARGSETGKKMVGV
mmetsp:Transcript_10925/g.20355  ORF Transcript_10925/g.20355 Transcript_10925/m.20355 type:complete len:518 (+) Transcript_10925:488-2041(+)